MEYTKTRTHAPAIAGVYDKGLESLAFGIMSWIAYAFYPGVLTLLVICVCGALAIYLGRKTLWNRSTLLTAGLDRQSKRSQRTAIISANIGLEVGQIGLLAQTIDTIWSGWFS